MTDKINDGGQAFPHGDPTHGGDIGMTLLDWLAGQALAGEMAGRTKFESDWQSQVAWRSYSVARAMLVERSANIDEAQS